MIGLLGPVFMFLGADGAVHVSHHPFALATLLYLLSLPYSPLQL